MKLFIVWFLVPVINNMIELSASAAVAVPNSNLANSAKLDYYRFPPILFDGGESTEDPDHATRDSDETPMTEPEPETTTPTTTTLASAASLAAAMVSGLLLGMASLGIAIRKMM